MDVREVYQRIQELQDEIAALGPLDPEVRKRIDYKFRLDWNYHSNNIEGGTLTVAETKSIMLGHVTVDDKPLKDILEMKGHDQTVKTIMSIGKGEVQLSEKRIKEIHAAIIQEDDPELKSSVGQWKTVANLIHYKNETIPFLEPEQVPEAIHKLLDWFKAEHDKIKRQHKDALPALSLAFEFHLRFLTIHPFYDGNGRVGRILLNLILIDMGYPPLIVTGGEKPKYNDLLTEIQVYGAPQNDLFIFLGKLLIRSLELVKRAIDGEEITQLIDPEIRLQHLERQLALAETEKRTLDCIDNEIYRSHLDKWIYPLLTLAHSKVQRVEHLFLIPKCDTVLNHKMTVPPGRNASHAFNLETTKLYFHHMLNQTEPRILSSGIRLSANLHRFKAGGEITFSITAAFIITFTPSKYQIHFDIPQGNPKHQLNKPILERFFLNPLTNEECEDIANDFLASLVDTIEYQSLRLGII